MTVAEYQTTTSAKFEMPFTVGQVSEFLEAVPSGATLAVTVHQGGDQRDPYPASVTFTATTTVGRR